MVDWLIHGWWVQLLILIDLMWLSTTSQPLINTKDSWNGGLMVDWFNCYGSVPFLNARFKGTHTGISSQLMKRLKPGWNLVEIWLIWVIWHVDSCWLSKWFKRTNDDDPRIGGPTSLLCLFKYICIYICILVICTHTYIYIHVYIYICINVYMYIQIYIHANIHTCVYTYLPTFTYLPRTYLPTYVHTYVRTYVHTYYAQTRIYIYTILYIIYTHTPVASKHCFGRVEIWKAMLFWLL